MDAVNRQTQMIDPLGKSATFAYNAAGYMTGTTDRIGRRRDFSYDDAGRQTGEVWYSWPSVIETNRLTFTYDANGNQLSARDYDGAYTMAYDALNRVTVVNDMWGKTLTFSYDANGNRTQVQDSAGGTTDSTFDALNRLTHRKYTESGSVQLSVTQVYDAASRLTEQWRYGPSYSLVARTSLTYDASSRLTNLQHRDGSGNNLANYTYTYDNASRLTTEVKNGTTVTYTYDNTDQLTADGTVTVTYDANGNRNNGSYGVGTGNRMTTDGTWTYTYNDEGNLTKKSKGAAQETWTYGYDERNQLLQVQRSQTDGGAIDRQVDFKYDVYGLRIEKSYDADGAGGGGATVSRFAYDGWKNTNQHLVGTENFDIWADLDGGSSLTTRYLRGDVIDQIFSRVDSGTTYWTLTDRLDSVRDVVNNSAVVKDSITYNGFGGITSETDANFRGRYTWTGREIDVETGYRYNRARYYDPDTGRWISQDPLGFDAGDSNLYRYVRNQTLSIPDPSGLVPQLTDDSAYDNFPGHGGVFFWGRNWKLDQPTKFGGWIINLVRTYDLFGGTTQKGGAAAVNVMQMAGLNEYRFWKVYHGQTEPVNLEIRPVLGPMDAYGKYLVNLINQQIKLGNPFGDQQFYEKIRDELKKVYAQAANATRRHDNVFWQVQGFPGLEKDPSFNPKKGDKGKVTLVPTAQNLKQASIQVTSYAYFLECPKPLRPHGFNGSGPYPFSTIQQLNGLSQMIDLLGGQRSEPIIRTAEVAYDLTNPQGSRTSLTIS